MTDLTLQQLPDKVMWNLSIVSGLQKKVASAIHHSYWELYKLAACQLHSGFHLRRCGQAKQPILERAVLLVITNVLGGKLECFGGTSPLDETLNYITSTTPSYIITNWELGCIMYVHNYADCPWAWGGAMIIYQSYSIEYMYSCPEIKIDLLMLWPYKCASMSLSCISCQTLIIALWLFLTITCLLVCPEVILEVPKC